MHVEKAVQDFRENGFAIVENALSADQVSALVAALDELTGRDAERIHNVADILGRHDAFLDLVDLPGVLPVVRELLGDNIWVNHTHYNVNPPDSRTNSVDRKSGYGWHRDGGVINEDIPKPAPLLSIKVAFYLSDLSEPGRGQTYVIKGSHNSCENRPGNDELPEDAIPVCVSPGTALLFDRRMIHSIRSRNESDITRKAVFIQYAYRWLCAVDAMSVDGLADRCDPIRKQLLGLTPEYNVIDGAAGRSSRYHPKPHDIPLSGNKPPNPASRIVRSLKRRISRLAGVR
jgi:ectoine hydroxylase-related dioxygenase (phytanoyl-CoA dioxygenase family)